MNKDNYTQDPDVQLMLAFKEGERKAFEELMKKYFAKVLNFAYRFLGDRQAAEDLAQEVFIIVYKKANTYSPQAKFQTWLLTIAKNRALNELRKRKRPMVSIDQNIASDEGQMERQIADQKAADPAQESLRQEKVEAIKQAIQSLPENQRLAVLLRRYEHLSYVEIAETLGTTETAVKSLLNRAKENLRDKLKEFL